MRNLPAMLGLCAAGAAVLLVGGSVASLRGSGRGESPLLELVEPGAGDATQTAVFALG